MLKITIANEEVLCSNDFTINKEMLNTPSVILNNVYPKTWELNKDYTTNFYYPNDYEQCLITDDTYYPYEEGITVEGTSFTLTNVDTTKESELMSVKGQTTQNGTPTPTTPVPINVVSGRQDVAVSGKNMFNDTLPINNTWINGTGGLTTINGCSIQKIPCVAGQAYTLSATWETDDNTYNGGIIVFYDSNDNMLSRNPIAVSNNMVLTKTAPANSSYMWVGHFVAKPQTIQVEKGNQKTSYEAYNGGIYPIDLQNKNLFDDTINNTWINQSGTVVSSTGSSTTKVKCKEGDTYSLTATYSTVGGTTEIIALAFYNSSGTLLNRYTSAFQETLTLTKTAPTNTAYLIAGHYTKKPDTIQLEKGQPTPYVQYRRIELCKIGDYQDRIYKTSGKNLFDKDNANILNAWFGPSQTTIQSNDLNRMLYIPCEPNTTYTFSKIKSYTFTIGYTTVLPNVSVQVSGIIANANATSLTITTGSDAKYLVLRFYHTNLDTLTYQQVLDSIQIELGNQATPYEPYGSGKWYLTKYVGKEILDESKYFTGSTTGTNAYYIETNITTLNNNAQALTMSNMFMPLSFNNRVNGKDATYSQNGKAVIRTANNTSIDWSTIQNRKDWLNANKPILYYVLATPTTTEITDTELISQLESITLLNGLNNIGISTPYLPFIMTLRYNHQEEHTDSDLIFCGVVKNSGQISLNPRQPHYSTLQILDYKTFLSEGELDTFVISNKTVLEAIQMIISDISQYGFELGTVSIQNENDIIGAYSTKDKSAYDVFNYIADITQSRWTTRVLDKGRIAIDFYDPSLMEQGTTIDYTQTWFKNNNIIDMSFNYGTWDYRNKQVMTSQEVYGSITQNQIINYDGYATQIMTEFPIGQINAIYVNGVGRLFSTNEEKNIGLTADFYYSPGDNFFERNMSIGAGSQIIISYIPIVEGRQIVTNASEISRVATASGVKGIVSRYENRNDATTSDELQKIGQSYIKYKGEPEITLTVKTESNLWEIGQRVQFNAPIEELDTEYMVKKKAINYVVTANKIFYTYELSSSFNSESAINYFDNQRAKANGNIKKGQYVSRNVDLEEEAQIIFYDTTATTTSITGNNVLQSNLETILGG